MRILRNHLITVFGSIQPEMFIEYLRDPYKRGDQFPDLLTYRHYALDYFKTYTYEEIDKLYHNFDDTVKKRGLLCNNAGVFALLPEYTLRVLSTDIGEPVCKQDEHLNWRSAYLQLGQDLLTTGHLAYLNVTENHEFTSFNWAAIIKDDDKRLSEILEEGLAENHFHLNGSTRGFDLSWLCLMNHPMRIKKFFLEEKLRITGERDRNERFYENLYFSISGGTFDNRLEWKDRLLIACYIRVNLFLWIQSGQIPEDFAIGKDEAPDYRIVRFVDSISYFPVRDIESLVDSVKINYGQCGRYKQPNGKYKYIDYAITGDIACNDDPCRSLVGERAFLFKALRLIYSGEANQSNMRGFANLFYLYILIKTQFRREMIQANGKYGFKNFAKYQDRKDLIFEYYTEYELEAKNLSVRDGMKRCHVKSLEMRIAPSDSYLKQCKKVTDTDNSVLFLKKISRPKTKEDRIVQSIANKWFYVLHFPKLPEKNDVRHTSEALYFLNHPRNHILRTKSYRQALSVAKAIEKYNWLCANIRGFDACTFEIGNRPECFATEFRFLRGLIITNQRNGFQSEPLHPKLRATYHVGEDFEDIIDGLRAIDEAVIFLELKSGERLGHALALGVNVRKYYALKDNWIILKKQDYLDNIVWMVNKAKALNISLSSAFKQSLYDKAAELIYEIYHNDIQICDYYNSWLLRGDEPLLYRFGYFDMDSYKNDFSYKSNNILSQYRRSSILKHYNPSEYESIRDNPKTSALYSRYHFDYKVRENGDKLETIKITEDYIRAAEQLQIGMQREISRKRIGIECNLSSNVLIGPFELYEQHPLFTFMPVLQDRDSIVQFASINTDDQGVFDTSLEEEYALLRSTLSLMRNSEGEPLYSFDEIYGYIEKVRRNGMTQTFP